MESEVLSELAAILVDLGDHERALTILKQLPESTLPTIAMRSKLAVANAYNGLGRSELALPLAFEAFKAYEAMPWLAQQEEALWALSNAHMGIGDSPLARDALIRADAISAPANNGRRALMRQAVPVDR